MSRQRCPRCGWQYHSGEPRPLLRVIDHHPAAAVTLVLVLSVLGCAVPLFGAALLAVFGVGAALYRADQKRQDHEALMARADWGMRQWR